MITHEQIENMKEQFAGSQERATIADRRIDVEAYLKHYDIEVVKRIENGGSTLHCLRRCLFDPSHAPNEAAIGITSKGKLFYQCFHNGCQGHTWNDARAQISGNDSLSEFIMRPDGSQKPIDTSKSGKVLAFDPYSVLKRGAELQQMDIQVEWIIDDIIPKEAITVFIGPAGYGKSMVTLGQANSVVQGLPWMGKEAKQGPVYIADYENPLPVVVERTRWLNIEDVFFWHTSCEIPPPKIDSPDWELFKALPPGLLIIDGHRASQRGDENSSKDTGLVMERWKVLRDLGFTIVIIHHTQKINEQVFRGSQALIDQADHALYFYPVRRLGSDDPVDSEDPDHMTYFLGTKDKTRFKHFKMYLKRAGEGRFFVAGDPDDEKLDLILSLFSGQDGITQTTALRTIKDELGIGKTAGLRLLKLGTEQGKWNITKGDHNSCLFQFSCFPPIYKGGKTGKQDSAGFRDVPKPRINNAPKHLDIPELSCLSDIEKTTGKQLFSPPIEQEDVYDVEVTLC